MKGWIKSRTVDRYLQPIRAQMLELIAPNSNVLDIGCGTGSFLINSLSKINYGLGIDSNATLIQYARRKTHELRTNKVEFHQLCLNADYTPTRHFDVVTACLFYHVLPTKLSAAILQRMSEISDQQIICAFCEPKNNSQKFLMWLDQRFNSHYRNFTAYQEVGYMEGLIAKTQLKLENILDTFDPSLKIYCVKKIPLTRL
ncbi:class I SAM-dependent methyltransferase [Porifericola rhodea]|uniref:class I SAM-dependent methyltransferase n=1 Tax=Porifericola rhodea TaxID=930972 RepID=UPI00266525E4|nr:class I SAM-dependent methyltransferase [Porifericola rhodea]WKN30551.1 class I SAM-dependent methyltransferase [Porifericola rhodea]